MVSHCPGYRSHCSAVDCACNTIDCNHLQEQANAFADVYHRNRQLFESERAQLLAGMASEQNLLTQQLTLLSAEQSLKDTQGQLIQSSVTLIRNLGGGWQWHDTKQASVNPSVMPRTRRTHGEFS